MSTRTLATCGERLARVQLSLVVEPGDPRLARLLSTRTADEVLGAIRAGRSINGSTMPEAWRLRIEGAEPRARSAIEFARARSIRWVCPGDHEWPVRLGDLSLALPINGAAGPPVGLWVRGSHDLAEAVDNSVAVVGARDATTYGSEVAGDLAADIADARATVLSGAAYGIDSCAHRGALAMRRPTIAVLACGADVDYPRAHAGLLARIADSGLVVSEQAPGQRPTKGRFLTRNRLIAGLTLGTVVVEAARRSGALNTLNWAAEIGRVAMGVPGPVTSQASVGVHQSLRSGQSIVVTNGAEVLEAVGRIGARDATLPRAPQTALDHMPAGVRAVLEAVRADIAETTEQIAARVPCEPEDAAVVLQTLRDDHYLEHGNAGWRLLRRADLSPPPDGRTVAT